MQTIKNILKVSVLFLFVGMFLRAVLVFIIVPWSGLSKNEASEFIFGIRFDLAASGLMTLIYFLLNSVLGKNAKVSHLLLTTLLVCYGVLWFGDTMYVKDTGKHIGYEMASMLSIINSGWSLFLSKIPYFIGLCIVSYFLAKPAIEKSMVQKKWRHLILAIPLCFVAFRGIEPIAQDPSWSFKAGNSVLAPTIALNPIYNMGWRLIKSKNLKAYVPLEKPENFTSKPYEDLISKRQADIKKGPKSQPNIVIVFLESWWGTRTRQTNPELTPFFNSLRKKSLSTQLFLAGGHRTTEGIFSSLCSRINPLGRSVMYSEIESNNYECLIHLLEKEKQYDSAFFQGSDKDTSGTGALTMKVGFKNSYGKNEIPDLKEKKQNAWGVYDDDLYSFVLQKMFELKEPHIVGINTNTTHDTQLKDIGSNKGFKLPIEQADRELEQFYKSLKNYYGDKEWLLVLVADHTNYSGPLFLDHYDIPVLFKMHNSKGVKIPEGQELKGIYQQMDIAQTLADITGISSKNFEGRSLLKNSMSGSGIYHNNQFLWADDSGNAVLMQIPKIENFKCYNIFSDRKLEQELQCSREFHSLQAVGASYLINSQDKLFEK